MRILVPTDFSSCALNAINYALNFSKFVNGEILIVHSIIFNQSSFINESDREEENTKRYNEANEKINGLKIELKNKFPTIPVSSKIEGGPLIPGIEELIKSEQIDLVIMGTEGATGIKGALFGSYTSVLMKHAPCPVLAVPPAVSFSNLSHILCATEMHESEMSAITNLIALAQSFKSKITFLNITNKHGEEELRAFQGKIKTITAYNLIELKLKNSSNVVETIENSACEGLYEIIVTLGRHRNFLDKLMGISVSKRLCLHTSVPILSYPHSTI